MNHLEWFTMPVVTNHSSYEEGACPILWDLTWYLNVMVLNVKTGRRTNQRTIPVVTNQSAQEKVAIL